MSPDAGPSLDVERTRLANERTFLAWWRTGVAAIAVAFAVGRIVPATVSGTTAWPYVTVGVFVGLVGLTLIVYGAKRYRAVDRAIRTGSSPVPDDRVLLVLSAVGVALGVATVLLVALEV
jgi:putative membrane protein